MRELPRSAVFTRAQARSLGWSDAALTRAARSGRLTRLRRGHFTRPTDFDPVLLARAAVRACSGSVVSHRSAALLHGLPLLDQAPRRPDLTVQPGCTGDVAGALLHRARMVAGDVVELDDVPVTSVPRTLVDLARTVSVDAAVTTIDAALNRQLTVPAELDAVLGRCANWPGARRAAVAVPLADARAESPLESVSRLVIARLGLPRPQPQAVVRDPAGSFVARVDFYWDEFGVFGEADGLSKYAGLSVLTDEKRRQERLEDLGLVAVRWGWVDVRNRQRALAQRVLRAFERGQLRDASGFPRLWSVGPSQTER